MMGSNDKPQDELFYAFNLDEMVPQDHLLRDIDQVLDLSNLREHLTPYYSHTGRPSVDPELMIRMLLIGYCCGIRSERQLCYEVSMNLAYRWFCKLKITDQVPHHSTFSKNRHDDVKRDALICLFSPVAPVYYAFLRLARTVALTSELIWRHSYQDNYVPQRVREATWKW